MKRALRQLALATCAAAFLLWVGSSAVDTADAQADAYPLDAGTNYGCIAGD